MDTRGNIYLINDRPIRSPLDEIDQLVHDIEIEHIAKHYDVNCGTIEYFHSLYGILPVVNAKVSVYYPTSKKILDNISRTIKVMKLKNNIKHVQLSKNN